MAFPTLPEFTNRVSDVIDLDSEEDFNALIIAYEKLSTEAGEQEVFKQERRKAGNLFGADIFENPQNITSREFLTREAPVSVGSRDIGAEGGQFNRLVDDTIFDPVKAISRGLVKGFGGAAAGISGFVGADEFAGDIREGVASVADQGFLAPDIGEEEDLAEKGFEILGEMGSFFFPGLGGAGLAAKTAGAIGATAKATKGLTAAGAATGVATAGAGIGAESFREDYINAVGEGNADPEELDRLEVLGAFFGAGTETLGFAVPGLKFLSKMSPHIFQKAATALTKNEKFIEALSKPAAEVGEAVLSEAVTEMSFQIAQNATASDIVEYDPERGLFVGAPQAAAAGGAAGGAFATILNLLFRRAKIPAPEIQARIEQEGRVTPTEEVLPTNEAVSVFDAGVREDFARLERESQFVLSRPSIDVTKPLTQKAVQDIFLTKDGPLLGKGNIKLISTENGGQEVQLKFGDVVDTIRGTTDEIATTLNDRAFSLRFARRIDSFLDGQELPPEILNKLKVATAEGGQDALLTEIDSLLTDNPEVVFSDAGFVLRDLEEGISNNNPPFDPVLIDQTTLPQDTKDSFKEVLTNKGEEGLIGAARVEKLRLEGERFEGKAETLQELEQVELEAERVLEKRTDLSPQQQDFRQQELVNEVVATPTPPRIQEQSLLQKAKHIAARQFTALKDIDPEVEYITSRLPGETQAYNYATSVSLRDLSNLLKKSKIRKPLETTPSRIQSIINDVIRDPDKLGLIDEQNFGKNFEKIRGAVLNIRQNQDRFSREISKTLLLETQITSQRIARWVAELRALQLAGKNTTEVAQNLSSLIDKNQARVQLIDTLNANLNEYLHTGYRIFRDPKYTPSDEIRSAFINQIALKLAKTRDFNDPTQFKQQATDLVDELERELKDSGSLFNWASSNFKLDKFSTSALIAKGDLTPEFKAFLGEDFNVIQNVASSAEKSIGIFVKNRILIDLYRQGLDTLFFEDPRPGMVQISDTKGFGVLAGMWTDPDLAKALETDFTPILFGGATGGFGTLMRSIIGLNVFLKTGKTVLSPPTIVRNFSAGPFFLISQGHINPERWLGGMARYAENIQDHAYKEFLLKERIQFDNAKQKEITDAITVSGIEKYLLPREGDTAATAVGKRSGRNFLEFFTNIYRLGDDFWKTLSFEMEAGRLQDAGRTREQAMKESAEILRNTYPTYSKVARFTKGLGRLPLTGTFVSFPAEVMRTGKNNIKLMIEDFNNLDKDPVAKSRFIGRALGQATSYATITALGTFMAQNLGLDDQWEIINENLQKLMPEWGKDHDFIVTGVNPSSGMPEYYDAHYWHPQAYIMEFYNALTNGENQTEAATKAFMSLMEPYIGVDLLPGAVVEYINSSSDPNLEDQAAAKFLRTLSPTAILKMKDVWAAWTGQINPKTMQPENLRKDFRGLFGLDVQELDIPRSIKYKAFETLQETNASKRKLKNAIADPNMDAETLLNTFQNLDGEYRKALKGFQEHVSSARDVAQYTYDLIQRSYGFRPPQSLDTVQGMSELFKDISFMGKAEKAYIVGNGVKEPRLEVSKGSHKRLVQKLFNIPNVKNNPQLQQALQEYISVRLKIIE